MTDPEVYLQVQKERRIRKYYKRISETLTKYDIKKDDIYISVQPFQQNIPSEVLTKGIGVGNGIFLINIKYLEEHGKSNAGN